MLLKTTLFEPSHCFRCIVNCLLYLQFCPKMHSRISFLFIHIFPHINTAYPTVIIRCNILQAPIQIHTQIQDVHYTNTTCILHKYHMSTTKIDRIRTILARTWCFPVCAPNTPCGSHITPLIHLLQIHPHRFLNGFVYNSLGFPTAIWQYFKQKPIPSFKLFAIKSSGFSHFLVNSSRPQFNHISCCGFTF